VKLTTKLLGAACAIALSALASTAANASVAGSIGGSYANLDGGGGSVDIWGVKGALSGQFGGGWGIQGQGDYHNISGGGADVWTFGGSVFWGQPNFKLNAQVLYHDIGGANFTNYGVGATWYAGPNVNVAARGGGYSGTGTSGGYVGGNIDWYVIPNLALSGRVDYIDLGTGITTETGQVEWLFSSTTPISIYGGYQHVDAGGSANVWFLGVKMYVNSGGGDLVDRQREGLGYAGDSPLFFDQY
jgi:hypothetical protein